MASKTIVRDRRRGRPGQNYVAGMFVSWGLKVRNVPDGYFPGWDIEAEGQINGKGEYLKFLCEVKYDIRLAETGNFYIDIEALRHSKASILAITEGSPIHTVYILPLQDVLNYALSQQNKIMGGEFKEPAVLIPKYQFVSELKPKVLTTKK
jgi:hypothetical protein